MPPSLAVSAVGRSFVPHAGHRGMIHSAAAAVAHSGHRGMIHSISLHARHAAAVVAHTGTAARRSVGVRRRTGHEVIGTFVACDSGWDVDEARCGGRTGRVIVRKLKRRGADAGRKADRGCRENGRS
ncbi:MAG TPA: hypothetical protein VGD08_07090 [Stellaceae bacterium]